MRIDLHNHTVRCNHAEGTVDEFVQQAIMLDIDVYGFSEHAPMTFDPHYRLAFDEMIAYESEIMEAKTRYQGQIDILLGYEVDYLPGRMDERVLSADVDYLIGSVHFLDEWGFDNPAFIGGYQGRDIDTIWEEYFKATEAMAKSGYFDIVGHLDLIKVFKYLPNRDVRLIARHALEAIKRANMVIELNTAGLRKPIGEIYPSPLLLEAAYELEIPITFASDAHRVSEVGYGYEEAVSLARKAGYHKAVLFERRDRRMVNF
jgi:histidinol-phosphatase (PHP family)